MTIEELERKLSSIVDYYYTNRIELNAYQQNKIKLTLMTCFSQLLGQFVGQPDKLERAYAELDKLIEANSGEGYIAWIEQQVSDTTYEKGLCRYLLAQCHLILQKNANHKPSQYMEVSNLDQLISKLNKDRETSENVVQSALLSSLITMFGSIQDYHNNARELPENWFQTTIDKLPLVTTALCAGLYIEEFAILFATVYVIWKGSDWLQKSQIDIVQAIGKQTHYFIEVFSKLAATAMAQGTNLIYLIFKVGLALSLEAQKRIFNSIMPSAALSDLYLSAEIGLWGHYFSEFEIKLIAVPLEEYIYQQSKQTAASLRYGHTKSMKMKELLKVFQQEDASNYSLEIKLKNIEDRLRKLSYNKDICATGTEAARAVTKALATLRTVNKPTQEEPGLFEGNECEPSALTCV
ncbi:hypothetical protein B1207_00295 [Legionella quinlivanii]|uniref:Uncharacterized protein n=1 Tax=Legionella quinlivanii TaxID=45073 RepID=A0A364LMU0_9GAMM|nr:hypothetical protein [Legionella quinlivanii]RAP38366.1 hypothetical protein B1207_00295 [Legionella quinlivanii]